jgi:hypothetical protein
MLRHRYIATMFLHVIRQQNQYIVLAAKMTVNGCFDIPTSEPYFYGRFSLPYLLINPAASAICAFAQQCLMQP